MELQDYSPSDRLEMVELMRRAYARPEPELDPEKAAREGGGFLRRFADAISEAWNLTLAAVAGTRPPLPETTDEEALYSSH